MIDIKNINSISHLPWNFALNSVFSSMTLLLFSSTILNAVQGKTLEAIVDPLSETTSLKERSLFSLSYTPFSAENCNPDSPAVEDRSNCRIQEVEQKAKKFVEETLKKGVFFESLSNGKYLIQDQKGNNIASFHPWEETLWGPSCPNSKFRKKAHTKDDIYFIQRNSWEQGNSDKRQYLVTLLGIGKTTAPPDGAIVEISSDLFVNTQENELSGSLLQTKRGYLERWVPEVLEGSKKEILDTNTAFLDELQEIGIRDLIVYNQDRREDQLQLTVDSHGKPHLTATEYKAILPWKLEQIQNLCGERYAKLPFTRKNLHLIEQLDPKYIEALVEKMDLSEQAAINARIMAHVVQRFAKKGASLAEIYAFVSAPSKGITSPLWNLVSDSQIASLESLPKNDLELFERNKGYRRSKWCKTIDKPWCSPLEDRRISEVKKWQDFYEKKHAKRIDTALNKQFWKEFHKRLNLATEALACHTLGTSNLCFRKEELALGVTHFTFQGEHQSLNQRFEVIAIDAASQAKIKVQDARGVFKEGEKPRYGRLKLDDLANRVPKAVAAISGSYFHYDVPKGSYYDWNGPPYIEGDPVGELVVKGKVITENLKEKNWGSMRINSQGEISITETLNAPLNSSSLPEYAIGAAPVLIQNGKAITLDDIPPARVMQENQVVSPGIDYPHHSRGMHARAAVCLTKEKNVLLAIVEGRQKATDKGLKIVDFSLFLKELGCSDALNLDGGGSADLVTKGPKDKAFKTSIASAAPHEGKRPTASAIVITV